MIFHPIHPGPPLERFVETIFHLKDYQPDHSIERIVPDSRSSLVIELDGQDRYVADNETFEPIVRCQCSWLSGPHRNYFSISAKKDTDLLAVQFRPGGLYPFVRQTVAELAEQVHDARLFFGDFIKQLRNDVLMADSSETKVRIVEAWLKDRMDASLGPPKGIELAINRIQNDPTVDTVTTCIAESGFSQKHTIHLFKKYTGYRPKDLQRILRFSHAVNKIQNDKPVSWIELSTDCGYSDQAHFIRDFKHFSGFTPTGFQQQETDRVNFIPMDESTDQNSK